MDAVKEVFGRIEIVVGLHLSLERFVSANHDANDFRARLEKYLAGLIEDLHLPASIELTLMLCEEADRFPVNRTLYRVTIAGRPCRIDLQMRTAETLSAAQLSQAVSTDINRNRDLLLTPALCETIRIRWQSENPGICFQSTTTEDFHDLLSLLVRQGFRVDRARTMEQETDKRDGGWSIKQKFEAIAASPTATAIRVLLNKTQYEKSQWPGTAPQLMADTKSFQNTLDEVDDKLFYGLGVILPMISVSVDESLEETEFRFQLNDLRLPPTSGPGQDQFLVDATLEELQRMGISGVKAINPDTGHPSAIVQRHSDILEKRREAFITYGFAGFIGLSLSSELRRNASVLLTNKIVECNLQLLELTSPALVHATRQRFDVLTLTWIMRELLEEGLSILNLRALLESLLSVTKAKPVEIDYYSAWVRAHLKRHISHKYSQGRNTLIVYLIAATVESRIAESNRIPLTGDEQRSLLQSLLGLVEESSAKVETPVILTTWEVRRTLRLLIEKELPSFVILSYQELSPDLNIQPIARLDSIPGFAH